MQILYVMDIVLVQKWYIYEISLQSRYLMQKNNISFVLLNPFVHLGKTASTKLNKILTKAFH